MVMVGAKGGRVEGEIPEPMKLYHENLKNIINGESADKAVLSASHSNTEQLSF